MNQVENHCIKQMVVGCLYPGP